jgi:hypothetical protein
MGVDVHAARLLALAKREGADFSGTVTLGHQWLHIDRDSMLKVLREMGVEPAERNLEKMDASAPFADALLSALGATDLVSVDASPYENATLVHDMNVEVPESLVGKFSLLIDCGTLEHIFNFPVAIRNCMKMLRVGGHMAFVTTANNFMGHGFYQFSPELFYRVLSPENGFQVLRMFISEVRPNAPWYELSDPSVIGQRVELTNNAPAYLLVLAKKMDDVAPLTTAPQQSDYEQLRWRHGERAAASGRSRMLGAARKFMPEWLFARVHWMWMRARPSFSASYYRLVGKDLR